MPNHARAVRPGNTPVSPDFTYAPGLSPNPHKSPRGRSTRAAAEARTSEKPTVATSRDGPSPIERGPSRRNRTSPPTPPKNRVASQNDEPADTPAIPAEIELFHCGSARAGEAATRTAAIDAHPAVTRRTELTA